MRKGYLSGASSATHPSLLSTLSSNLPAAADLLIDLIAIPSTRGRESEVGRVLQQRLTGLGKIELVPIPSSLMKDPDFSFRESAPSYEGTFNLRVTLGGGDGRSLALNTHMDVVPPSEGQESPFAAVEAEGRIYGRGAVDAKGQIVVLWLLLKTLHDLRLNPLGRVTMDFVIEEECGGNGTLAVIRNGIEADAAIVLEPTDLQVVHLVRGAVWFTVEAHGKAGHSGSPGSTSSALKKAIRAMQALEAVREKLLAVSREELPSLSEHPNPMPCNFGILHSGEWPATAPSKALLKGVFGFLPPFRREEIQNELRGALKDLTAEIRFDMLNNDPSVLSEDHPLVQGLLAAARLAGIVARPAFMNASCDAWRYSVQQGIPTVVFGPGSLAHAHSADEHIVMADIMKAAEALMNFIDLWCGWTHD